MKHKISFFGGIIAGMGVVLIAAGSVVIVKKNTVPESYAWQTAQPSQAVLDQTPPMVKILPQKPMNVQGAPGATRAMNNWGTTTGSNNAVKAIGVGMSAEYLMQTAYEFRGVRNRMVLPPDMPQEPYDFIANLPTGAMEALRKEAAKKLKLTGRKEMREMDVLVLKVNNTNAPGIKPYQPGQPMPNTPTEPGMTIYRNVSMATIVSMFESNLQTPVVDQTGLTARYEMSFRRPTPGGTVQQRVEQMKQTALEHLGLDLISTRQPVEMFIIEKIK